MKKFNKNFMLGSATAAHQVEGNNIYNDCWVEENLKHSLYDEPSLDAVDHYNRYKEDIRLLKESGLNTYRFSIEWSRIQSERDLWNHKEIEHYRDVINCCLDNGITPIVTMFHFSSPKWLISMGGWENPEVISLFAEYCRRVVSELGDIMEYVCTINEANMRMFISEILKTIGAKQDAQVGINLDSSNADAAGIEASEAFGLKFPEQPHTFVSPCTPEGDIIVMKAHEAARDAMKAECPHLKIGITLTVHNVIAVDGGEENAHAEWDTEFLHYLPYIQHDDFLGVQCYTRKRFNKKGLMPYAEGVPLTQMGYEECPEAVAGAVRDIAKNFKGDIIVTENGIATADDHVRSHFIEKATDGIKECIDDGIPVKGYIYWSLLDNFEWQKGYSMTFGLIGVDRKTQTRYPKESLYELGSFI
ncbi:MAG: family 1 glycosylhydrolase [Lachnospiraceae bacterium]|nr:family 1 glycosylhydrolase [Lachnospiraceae bacterium]